MKANELMLGDWVLCDGKSYQIAEIGGMVCIDYENELFASLEDIEPISLTAEILEKNGFASLSGHDWWYKDFHISLSCTKDLTLVCGRTIQFSFVHELQHALRLCGIEKTIEL